MYCGSVAQRKIWLYGRRSRNQLVYTVWRRRERRYLLVDVAAEHRTRICLHRSEKRGATNNALGLNSHIRARRDISWDVCSQQQSQIPRQV